MVIKRKRLNEQADVPTLGLGTGQVRGTETLTGLKKLQDEGLVKAVVVSNFQRLIKPNLAEFN